MSYFLVDNTSLTVNLVLIHPVYNARYKILIIMLVTDYSHKK